jgi:Periplasmic copper-binding protein (NosD)
MPQRLTIAVLGTAMLALFALAPAASAATLTCGQTITQSITLDADVSCPDVGSQEFAWHIGASGITVDLNGHKITSHGKGIENNGYNHVTLRNGTIAGNQRLVEFTAVKWNTLSKLTLKGIVDGLRVNGGDHNFVADNWSQGVTFGVKSDHTVVANNLTDGWEAAIGVTGDRNLIAGNTTHSGALHLGGAHDYISGNHIASSPLNSTLDGLTDGKVVDNVIVSYGQGGPALTVSDSSGNVFRGNAVFGGSFALQSGADNVLRKNVVYGAKGTNSTDGFVVEAGVTGTQLINNLASRNADDGFDVRAPGTLLKRNQANDNGGLGINAVAGVIDGSGNRASGNGNAAQCTGVTCN